MKITEFLEKFLPNYHSRNDVARLNDLYKFLDLEMTDEEVREKGFVQNCYDDVYFELSELQDKLFAEALQNACFESLLNEKTKSFEFVSELMIKHLAENYHPHTCCIVDSARAEILEGKTHHKTTKYLVD